MTELTTDEYNSRVIAGTMFALADAIKDTHPLWSVLLRDDPVRWTPHSPFPRIPWVPVQPGNLGCCEFDLGHPIHDFHFYETYRWWQR